LLPRSFSLSGFSPETGRNWARPRQLFQVGRALKYNHSREIVTPFVFTLGVFRPKLGETGASPQLFQVGRALKYNHSKEIVTPFVFTLGVFRPKRGETGASPQLFQVGRALKYNHSKEIVTPFVFTLGVSLKYNIKELKNGSTKKSARRRSGFSDGFF